VAYVVVRYIHRIETDTTPNTTSHKGIKDPQHRLSLTSSSLLFDASFDDLLIRSFDLQNDPTMSAVQVAIQVSSSSSSSSNKKELNSNTHRRQRRSTGNIPSGPAQQSSLEQQCPRSGDRRKNRTANNEQDHNNNDTRGGRSSKGSSSEQPRGKRSSEILNPNVVVSSQVTTERRGAPERDDNHNRTRTKSRSRSSDGTSKRRSKSSDRITKDSIPRRSISFDTPTTNGPRPRSDRDITRGTRRAKSPGGRIRAKASAAPPSSNSRPRSWSDRKTSSDYIAEQEPKTDHPPALEAAKSKRRGSSRGPRDKQLSQSHHQHGRSTRGSRGDRLSKSSHNKPSRTRPDRLNQSAHAIVKAPAAAPADDEDDTIYDSSENELSSSELGNEQQDKTRDAELTAVPSTTHPEPTFDARRQAPPTPSQEKPEEDEEVDVHHELLNQSVPLDTRHTSNLEALLSRPATTFTDVLLDAPSLDPPSICLPSVSKAQPEKERNTPTNLLSKPKPVTTIIPLPSSQPSRDKLSQQSRNGRSRGSRGDRLSKSSHNKPPVTRPDHRLSQSAHFNFKAPALAEDDTIDSSENEPSSSEQEEADARQQAPPSPSQEKLDHVGVTDTKSYDNHEVDAHHKLLSKSVPANLVAPLDPPSLASSGLPLEAHSGHNARDTSNLEALLSRPAVTAVTDVLNAPSLDPPSICIHSISHAKPAGKEKHKLADLLNQSKQVTTFSTLMDAPSLAPPSICAIPLPPKTDSKKTQVNSGGKKPVAAFILDAPSLADPMSGTSYDEADMYHELFGHQSVPANLVAPLDPPSLASPGLPHEAHSGHNTRHTSNLEALLSRQAFTAFTTMKDAPALDPPSIPSVSHAKPGKEKHKLADLLSQPKAAVTTFRLVDPPSLEPPSICAIPLPPKTESKSKKTPKNPILVTTFTLMDTPSLEPPSVCAIPLPPKTDSKKRQAKSGKSTNLGVLAAFSASADLSKQSDPWASSWGGGKHTAGTVIIDEEPLFPTWDHTGPLKSSKENEFGMDTFNRFNQSSPQVGLFGDSRKKTPSRTWSQPLRSFCLDTSSSSIMRSISTSRRAPGRSKSNNCGILAASK
jgi:hypothetical protein